jgi:hypothetical protein
MMALSLETKRIKPPRIIIYGSQGCGKSTFGSLAPNPVFIQTEDGIDALDVQAFPLARSFQDVLNSMRELAETEHDFKTLVVDSVDWLERLIHTQVCAEKKVGNIDEIPYGKGFSLAIDIWRQYIDALNYLRDEKDMVIIQIAHAEIKRFENPETDSYDRYNIKLHKSASALLLEHSDIVLFLNHVVNVKKTKEGFSERKRAFGDGERVLYSEERPAFIAKNRYALPPEIPFTRDGSYWATIAQYVPYFGKMMGG